MNTMESQEYNNVPSKYLVQKVLGQGYEGIVYLVEDKEKSEKKTLKVFHEPHTRDWIPGVIVYANKVEANDFGLPEIELIYQDDKIIGAVYPYVPLQFIHWRIMRSSLYEKAAQSMVSSYCEKQYFLMAKHGLVLWDAALGNLMLDGTGQWHFCDIGEGILLLDAPILSQNGLLGYGFVSMLLSIYGQDLHSMVPHREISTLDEPCIYSKNESLDAIAAQHGWVKEIVDVVRSQNASIFHDPEFYRNLGGRFPGRLPWPSLVFLISDILTWLDKLRGKLGKLRRKMGL